MAHYVVRIARHAGIALLFVAAAVAGTLSGVLFAASGDMPQVSSLDDYAPSTITRVYGGNGEVIGEFATQRRVVISYDQISPLLRQAIVSAEDRTSITHLGLSIPRIVVTAVKDLVTRAARRREHAHAAARAQPLPHERTKTLVSARSRKRSLTIQIEKRYTKREIFTLYCNHDVPGATAPTASRPPRGSTSASRRRT